MNTRRRDWCKHYTGFSGRAFEDDTKRSCRAGICYREAFGAEPGIMRRAPCLGEDTPETIACEKRLFRTAEEIAAEEAEMAEWIRLVGEAMKRCREHAGHRRGIAAAEVECPKCGGRLRYSIASYNGHLHGHCMTKGCLSWMQ